MTPRDRASGLRRETNVYAPRNLKEPVRWSISGLSQSRVWRSISSARSSGVRIATPRNRCAASRMSASETRAWARVAEGMGRGWRNEEAELIPHCLQDSVRDDEEGRRCVFGRGLSLHVGVVAHRRQSFPRHLVRERRQVADPGDVDPRIVEAKERVNGDRVIQSLI